MSDTRGDSRVVIEGVKPEIDGGRFAIKRTVGERVTVEADAFADGHDAVRAVLRYRADRASTWQEVPMEHLGNDRWRAEFRVEATGRYRYTVLAWIDHFLTWRRDLSLRIAAANDTAVDYAIGARMIERAAGRAPAADADRLRASARLLGADDTALPARRRQACDEELLALMLRHADRAAATTYERELPLVVDRKEARFSAWYEFFPRGCAPAGGGRHATLRDCEAHLGYVAALGFDVVYFPPIHPIGRTHRKGRNNAAVCAPADPGSPWAIGAAEGGHKSVHPQLGTLEDFRRLVARARALGLEIALDIALQCSPDHPYVREHPEWFRVRPDGTVQYAENPPKKYQDIYPFDFECEAWRELWDELKSIFLFWLEQGVRIFRIDNPHTKPFRFWEWVIAEIRERQPDALFLAEAFTRPKVSYALAKRGFTQSYTYFAWRNTKAELTDYFTELTRTEVREFFRPNLWPNTPDILTEYLQYGGRAAFMIRLVLAATLGASYGIYGPAFELCENAALEPGGEEYLDSEKYAIRRRDLDRPDSLAELITRLNRVRRANPSLQADGSLCFHAVDNEQILCYSKHSEDRGNVVLVVVNLDPHHTQSGWVELDLDELQVGRERPYVVDDQLTERRCLWQGARNFVEIDPAVLPARVFLVRRRIRSERDFDYYL